MSDEAHLPTEQACPQAPSRLSRAHGNAGRPQGAGRAPGAGPQTPVGVTTGRAARLQRLRERRDFLAANKGRRAATDGFVLLAHTRGDLSDDIRVGFTVTKKIGGAVVRNRLKRRLRAAAAAVLPVSGRAGTDYVLIGRAAGLDRPFGQLIDDLSRAAARLAS